MTNVMISGRSWHICDLPGKAHIHMIPSEYETCYEWYESEEKDNGK
jgi:hypothetical protein